MAVSIRQIHPIFVGEVGGVDLRRKLSANEVAAIEEGMNRYAVLIFPGQDITDEQQIAFTREFGEIENSAGGTVTKPDEKRLSYLMNDVSNLGQDHQPMARDDRRRLFNLGNQLWHSDSSFRAVPAKYSILSGRTIVDRGGNTEFADMRAAYDALSDEMKATVGPLVCEHSLMYSRGLLGFTELSDEEQAMFRPMRQSLVRTHPKNRRKSLYLASHAGTIVGWPVPEARAFLRDVNEEATRPENVYVHQWRQFDLVMWDNRQTMHRVRRFDETKVRDMRRTTVAGDAPTAKQVAA
ncbi:MAG TPA: TauD/TfdA family dioxygenase [Stellaceae bacterium]|nr:TauD/TfdA family dioxygenase [Stellaceae bacterium]